MLRFIDGFDHYRTPEGIDQKWTNIPFHPLIVQGIGSCLSAAAKFEVFDQMTKGIAFGSNVVGFGHWLNVGLQAVGTSLVLGAIGHEQSRHVILVRHYDGSLQVRRNDAFSGSSTVALGASPPDVVRQGVPNFIEMKATIANVGSVVVRVNGVTVLTLAGVDTMNAASSTISSVWMGDEAGNGNSVFYIDDFYTFDDVAGVVTDLLGPVRVEWLKPEAPGTHIADFSTVGAASQWQAVRDLTGPDGDTSYVQSQTPGHKHSSHFTGTGLPAGNIYGAQVLVSARITDAGYRGIRPLIVQGGADHLGVEQYPATGYRYLHELFETDPDTGVPWTISGINSAEFGAQVSS